jgi:hypothetical protein
VPVAGVALQLFCRRVLQGPVATARMQYQVEGSAIPASLIAAVVADAAVNRAGGATPQAFVSTAATPVSPAASISPTASAAAGSAAQVMLLVSVPASGLGSDVAGTVTGLAAPAAWKAAVFVASPEQQWWGPKAQNTVDPAGGFTVSGWVVDPHDLTAPQMSVLIVPGMYVVPSVLGADALPSALIAAAAVQATGGRGSTAVGTGGTAAAAIASASAGASATGVAAVSATGSPLAASSAAGSPLAASSPTPSLSASPASEHASLTISIPAVGTTTAITGVVASLTAVTSYQVHTVLCRECSQCMANAAHGPAALSCSGRYPCARIPSLAN